MRWVKLLLALLLCPGLVSCSPFLRDIRVPCAGWECSVSWEWEGERFEGSFSWLSGEAEGAVCVFRVTSPEHISQLSVRRSGGRDILFMGETSLGEAPRGYSRLIELLLPRGAPEYLCRTSVEGREALCFRIGEALWCFSVDRGLPLRIEGEGGEAISLFCE